MRERLRHCLHCPHRNHDGSTCKQKYYRRNVKGKRLLTECNCFVLTEDNESRKSNSTHNGLANGNPEPRRADEEGETRNLDSIAERVNGK